MWAILRKPHYPKNCIQAVQSCARACSRNSFIVTQAPSNLRLRDCSTRPDTQCQTSLAATIFRSAALLGPHDFHEHVCKGFWCSENDAMLGKMGTASTVLPLVWEPVPKCKHRKHHAPAFAAPPFAVPGVGVARSQDKEVHFWERMPQEHARSPL